MSASISARRILRLARIGVHIIRGIVVCSRLAFLRTFAPQRHRRVRPLIEYRWLSKLARIMAVHWEVVGTPVKGPAVFAANHISWLDVAVLSALCNADFIAKQEVREWPLFGWFAREGGSLFVRRGNAGSARKIADLMTWRLVAGGRITIFPEGTSSRGDRVKPFRSPLFQAALRAECPVQPVALSYDGPDDAKGLVPFVGEDDLVSNLWRVIALPRIEVRVAFGAPLATAGRDRKWRARQS
jgi:1-acyl-sn-glycerol-3-phosphate acyltransferase